MRPLPLRLALDPMLPSPTPTAEGRFEYGYRLRLPGGPALSEDDPLLEAFGASVEWLAVGEDREEALQTEAFDPGRKVKLLRESSDSEDPPETVGVWDEDALRQAGTLLGAASDRVSAGTDLGLEQRALVLCELRAESDDRREALCLLVYAPALVRVKLPPPTPRIERPVGRSRPRLVLVADASGDVRWWDPSANAGPLQPGDLPLSAELRHELDCLRDALAELVCDDDESCGFDCVHEDRQQEALQTKAEELWRRARSELGRSYTVGFLGPGMRRPVWSPSELAEEHDSAFDIPF